MPENNTVVFTDPAELVQDMKNYKYVIYVTQIQVIQPKPKCFVLAAHTQQNFTDVNLDGRVIEFYTKFKGMKLSTLRICQPLVKCTKTSIPGEARYILEVENCESVISMLAVEPKT